MRRALLLLFLGLFGCSNGLSDELADQEVYQDSGPDSTGPSGTDNHPPVLHKVGNRTVPVGETLSVVLAADDADGDTLTYSVYGDLPNEATFHKAEARLVWAPSQTGGPYFVTLVVSDKRDFDSETIELTAVASTQAHAPAFEKVGEQLLEPEVPFELRVQASDPDGDPLTYWVEGSLPSGATFDANGHTFRWTPTQGEAGVKALVVFVVSDGLLTARMEVQFAVKEPLATCQDDLFEPNNSAGQAAELSGDDVLGTPVAPLVLCPGDTDMFRVALECGDSLYAAIDSDGPQGDLDLALVRAQDGEQVDEASGAGSHETVGVEGASIGGDYLIQVYGVPAATASVSYSLEVLLDSGGTCLADELEPNNTQVDALPLMDKDYLDGLNLCCDQDWFEITPTAGSATIRVEGVTDTLMPSLVDESGGTTPLPCTSGVCAATVTLSSSPLYLVVDGLYGATYTLELTISSNAASGSCVGACGDGPGDCWCDEGCQDYGDCCPDACFLCGVC